MKKLKLIYNSVAGQSKFKYFLDTVIEKFTSNGYEVSIYRASKKTKLYEFLKDVDNNTYGIIIAGGDGTINRVVNVMMKNNINVPIGIIPAGTSNDFARHIKMPKKFSLAIDRILKGNIKEVDVGLANDKYFINVCSAGLFTNASYKTDVVLKNLIGKAAYYFTAVYQLFHFKPFDVRIETTNDIIIEKVCLFLIFNGSSAGGINKFTNNSSIQDGLLDILVIKSCGFFEASILLAKVLTGRHFDDKNVIYLKENWLKIDRVRGKCDDPDLDGDIGPKFPMDVKCIEKGIKMFL
ncbi:MAG: YegS/Rv2252/BmrU family lipid kinase [Clostridia bacterium]